MRWHALGAGVVCAGGRGKNDENQVVVRIPNPRQAATSVLNIVNVGKSAPVIERFEVLNLYFNIGYLQWCQ